MKRFIFLFLCLLLLLGTGKVFAQKANPDTLIIGTKNGKIILVSDSLKKFKAINVDELVKKALLSIKDSLVDDAQMRKKLRDGLYTRKIKNRPFRLLPIFGLGFVRDKFSPFLGLSLDFAPQRQDYYLKQGGEYTFINIASTAFFTFKDNGSGYQTQNNIFLEGTIGNRINNSIANYGVVSELSAGIGYLIHREGNYFTNHTLKVFVNVGLKNSFIKIRPELYITDQFKNAFPGLAVKFFW